MEIIITGMAIMLVGIIAVLIAMIMERSEIRKGQKFFYNFAPRRSEVIDIFTGNDGQPYVKWKNIGDDTKIFTSSAKYFLDTHHVCW